jgi:polysaccharide biosynthesis transport protein
MSLDERVVLSEEQTNSQALALTQISTVGQPSSLWTKQPQEGESQPKTALGDVSNFLHAFRRHWLPALGLGLLVAALAGPTIWYGLGAKYAASVFLRVAYQEKSLVFSAPGGFNEAEYDIFKNTQMQLIQNRFVMSAALRKPEINRLPILKKQDDPVKWLMDNVSLSFPGKSEVMQISITTNNPKESADIVTAILNAYKTEVLDTERRQRAERKDELDKVYAEKDAEVRGQRSKLKDLADQLGTAESETLNLKQKLTLEELSTYRQESVHSQFELGRLRSELASRQADLDSVKGTEISDMECEMFAQNDSELKGLIQEIMIRKMDSKYTEEVVVPGSKMSRFASKDTMELERFKNDYSERMKLVREEIQRRRVGEITKEVKRYEAAIKIAQKQQESNDEEVTRLKKLAEQFGSTSVDVEMLRADIDNREKSLNSIMGEREKIRIELRATSRIIPLQEKAEVPLTASNTNTRTALTFLAVLVGLCLPVGGFVLWDIQFNRINTAADISNRLGIPIIGSMPIIPARVLRKLGSPTKRNQLWQLRLTESVDGITARLLRRAELEQRRVVMVTSAVSGEGKTTLAAQLAMSLARAGRRTVLVDFDLRQPSFDEAFDLQRSPGVSEILRNETDLVSSVQQTATENLSVITAGRWNRMALSALANGAASTLFKELRDDYEFVVVDTSPILPIADARFVSQYVDSVVLCVFRDISEAPRIRATCEILEAFGVQCIEAAVTGSSESDNARTGYYRSSVSA